MKNRYCFYGLKSRHHFFDEGQEFASYGGAVRYAKRLSRRWEQGVEIISNGEKQSYGEVVYSASLTR